MNVCLCDSKTRCIKFFYYLQWTILRHKINTPYHKHSSPCTVGELVPVLLISGGLFLHPCHCQQRTDSVKDKAQTVYLHVDQKVGCYIQ